MNTVNISGRLVYEPEVKKTASEVVYLSSRIAVDRHDKNKNTDFFSFKAWNKTAEFIGKYFKKGDGIEITGKLYTDSYEKSDGTKVSEVYINVLEVNFPINNPKREEAPGAEIKPSTEQEISDADLPFQI